MGTPLPLWTVEIWWMDLEGFRRVSKHVPVPVVLSYVGGKHRCYAQIPYTGLLCSIEQIWKIYALGTQSKLLVTLMAMKCKSSGALSFNLRLLKFTWWSEKSTCTAVDCTRANISFYISSAITAKYCSSWPYNNLDFMQYSVEIVLNPMLVPALCVNPGSVASHRMLCTLLPIFH